MSSSCFRTLKPAFLAKEAHTRSDFGTPRGPLPFGGADQPAQRGSGTRFGLREGEVVGMVARPLVRRASASTPRWSGFAFVGACARARCAASALPFIANTMMGDFCVLECHFLHRELRKSSFWVGKAMVNVHRAWHGSRRPKADDSLEILPGN